MRSPRAKSASILLFWCLILMIISQSVCSTKKLPIKRQSRHCKHVVLYYPKSSSTTRNATSATVANHTKLGDFNFGMLVVFNDKMTNGNRLLSPEVATAHGFYFYNSKTNYNGWFAYTLVFNSAKYKGTLNIMGADFMVKKTRNLSVVGGTGDFFMASGIATIQTDIAPDDYYFRLKMDIKFYKCH